MLGPTLVSAVSSPPTGQSEDEPLLVKIKPILIRTRHPRVPIVTSYKTSSSSPSSDQHNVLPVSSSLTGRLQLLPLPRQGSTAGRVSRINQLDVDKKVAKKRDKSPVAKAATSFIESLSSSNLSAWFGSGS